MDPGTGSMNVSVQITTETLGHLIDILKDLGYFGTESDIRREIGESELAYDLRVGLVVLMTNYPSISTEGISIDTMSRLITNKLFYDITYSFPLEIKINNVLSSMRAPNFSLSALEVS